MKYLLCCFLLLQFSIIYGRKFGKSPTGKREAGVTFVEQARDSLKNGDLGGFITAVGTVSAYVSGPTGLTLLAGFSMVGMAITAFGGKQEPPSSPFLEQLREHEVILDEIAAKIKGVGHEFAQNLKKYSLFEKGKAIALLQAYWKRFSGMENNDIFKSTFGDMCRNNYYDLLPRYFTYELTRHDLNSGLAKEYIGDLDRRKYLNFATAIFIHFSEAVILQYNCTVAIFENYLDLNKTLEFYKEQNARFWEQMERAMFIAHLTFDENAFNHAKDFVKNYILQHTSKNVNELHNALNSTITSKYYWRNWTLIIRDAPYETVISPNDKATNATNQKYNSTINVAGKTVVLSSPEGSAKGPQLCPYVDDCNNKLFRDGCKYIISQMKNCVAEKKISGIGCISEVGRNLEVADPNYNVSALVYRKSKCEWYSRKETDENEEIHNVTSKFPDYFVYWIN